ncbi:MAG TPA: protein kinase [Bryobacteraceae bacterium]|nr:protein kinase [Bryobacteraceae bacterium]
MQLSKRTFLTLVTASAIVITVLMVYAGTWVRHNAGRSKYLGWTAASSGGSWFIQMVDPNGPAAGRLFPGDRILAAEGNGDVARIGPSWTLRDRPNQPDYSIEVVQGGTSVQYRLAWPVRADPYGEFWLWMLLLTGFIYFAVGLLIAYGRPEDHPGRRAVVSGLLNGIFFSGVAMNPRAGMVEGAAVWFCMLALAVRPYHVLASYRFTAGFPAGDLHTPRWQRFERILFGSSILAWLPSAYAAFLRALGPQRAAAIAAMQHPLPMIAEQLADPLTILLALAGTIGTVLVCRRNYRLLPEGDQKRRLRWVILGVAVGVSPTIVLFPFLLAMPNTRAQLMMIHLINLFAAACPLCVAYAVIVHRALGLRVVLRSGLRYMLARNSLRFAMIVPLAWAVASVALNPRSTFADLALSTSGKINLILLALSALALRYRTALLGRIDRRFFRESYQQDQIFIALAEAVSKTANVAELSRMLSSQIQSALHPRSIFVASRESDTDFSVVFSSSVGSERRMGHLGLAPSVFDAFDSSVAVDEESMSARSGLRGSLDNLGVRLVVPLRGPNEGLVGVILLGEKMSEEPYTRHDRLLLNTVASQTGIVWENLQLRDRLKREQQVRREVLQELTGKPLGFVLECPACGACYDSEATICESDGRTLTPSLPITRTIENKYRLTRRIGSGGMGAVYEAEDLRLSRPVAIKVMTGRLFGDSAALQRFSREARASAKLDHSNVVRIFDFGELSGGGAYLVLEFLKGVNLRVEIHRQGALNPQETADVLEGVFAGIEAAHTRGIVHRDLKPENIFLVRQNSAGQPLVKILDFGLAVVRDLEFSDGRRLTHAGTAIGTIGYMSREQFVGETVDERTDIYALGVIAVEMLTGDLGIQGPAFAQIGAVVRNRLAGLSPEYGALADVLLRALPEKREERFQTVGQFRDMLLPVLRKCAVAPSLARAATAVQKTPLSTVETRTQAISGKESSEF